MGEGWGCEICCARVARVMLIYKALNKNRLQYNLSTDFEKYEFDIRIVVIPQIREIERK